MKFPIRPLFASFFTAFCILKGAFPVAAAPAVVITDTSGISGFELYGSGIYWWSSHGVCGTEFPHQATIRLRGTLSSATKFLASDCTMMQGEFANTVRDDAYAYFFSNHQLMRKALNAAESDPAQPLPTGSFNPTLPSNQPGAVLALANGRLYWSRYNGSGLSEIYWMPSDGSEAPHDLLPIVAGAEIQKMELAEFTDGGTTIDGLVILFSNGKLYRYKFNASGTLNQLATGVSDFAIQQSFVLFSSSAAIYAAVGQSGVLAPNAAPGKLLRIDAASGNSTTVYTSLDNNQVLAVATDSAPVFLPSTPKNVYIAEGIVTCGSLFCTVADVVIKRHVLPAATTGWQQIVSTGGGYNLRSDDTYLYFAVPNSIQKIPTDAPAQQLDLAADALEVVQAIQDLNSSIPLVANRPTFVRGYAHLAANTTGVPTWFPSAKLRGFLNGTELPGSPIQPINNTKVDQTNDLGVLRSDLSRSFLFELPANWVQPGPLPVNKLSFEMTVNPDLGVPETPSSPLANNKITSVPAILVAKGWPCIVTAPILSTGPTYYPDDPSFGPIFDRARSLMPVENFSVFAFAVTDPIGDPDEPFDMLNPNEDDRNNTADDILDAVDDMDLDSDPCDDKDDAHYIGMMHPAAVFVPGVIGEAYVSDQNSWITMFNGAISGHGPGGGEDMAHELGHNYGRQHIMCGSFPPDQADFDPVPFPSTLGSPILNLTSSPFGFDPINQTVIPPTAACDVMSYGGTKWSSIWYWTSLLGVTAAPAQAFSLATITSAPSGQVLLVSGTVDVSRQIAFLRPFKLLPETNAPAKQVARSRRASSNAATAPSPFKVRFLDGAGTILGEVPLAMKQPSNHDVKRGARLHFGQYVDFTPGARTILIVQDANVLGERFVSAHAPVLTLGAPAVNPAAQSLSLSWTSSDPDGDPLRFTVQYSPDDGARWFALKSNWKAMEISVSTAMLPGGTRCRLRVTASDGVNATLAVTDPFAIALHPPQVHIQGLVPGERIPFGSTRRLQGTAFDAETPSQRLQLVWNLAGPTSLNSTGTLFSIRELSPGPYSINLSATDTDGQTGSAAMAFQILPLTIPDAPAPVLDGMINDDAYSQAALVRMPLGNGEFVPVRLLHSNGFLYVSFSGLKYGAAARIPTPRKAGLRVDPNASADALAKPGDAGFFVDENGIPSQEIGTGAGMASTLSPQPGFTAAISRGTDSWSAELRIADSLVSGWNHPAGLMLDHDTPHWPPAATDNSPATWAPVFFGTQPPAPANQVPIANAGHAQRVTLRAPRNLYLDGTASSDADSDRLTFSWTQVSGPAVSLVNSNSATPLFLAQPVTAPATLVFELKVGDGKSTSAPDQVQVTILPPLRLPPPAPAQEIASLRSDGQLEMRLFGAPRQPFRIQSSSDLKRWDTVRTVYSDFSGRIDASQIVNFTNRPVQFFRAVTP